MSAATPSNPAASMFSGTAATPPAAQPASASATAGVATAAHVAEAQQSSRPYFVLVVDDDEANRESLARRLIRRGYQVAVAPGGVEALNQVAAHPDLDLVLLDVMMPGMDGLEVLSRVRQQHSSTRLPIIMATAKDGSSDLVRAFELGANDYVVKPLDFNVVAARVQTHVSMKRNVEQIIELERQLNDRNQQLEKVNQQLVSAAERAQHELSTAAKVQETFLPRTLPVTPGVTFSWISKPCQELAGDSLNICPLDADHVALYVLDVTGHGVAASLLAVAANRALSPTLDPQQSLLMTGGGGLSAQPTPPTEVVAELSRRFGWNDATGQFLTIFYGVLNTKTRIFTYTSAGHPPAVRVERSGAVSQLKGVGLPVGIGEQYDQQTAQLAAGDRIFIYSDGVTETMNDQLQQFGSDNLLRVLSTTAGEPLHQVVHKLLDELQAWRGAAPAQDDVSVLAFELAPEAAITNG